MGRRALVSSIAAAAVLAVPASPAAPASANAPLRSTEVTLVNQTGCDLVRGSIHLNGKRGHWASKPPTLIASGQQGSWRTTTAKGINALKGIDGRASYTASNCAQASKVVQVHWKNPIVGSNTYRVDGTDPAFLVTQDPATGRGNHAKVTFLARIR